MHRHRLTFPSLDRKRDNRDNDTRNAREVSIFDMNFIGDLVDQNRDLTEIIVTSRTIWSLQKAEQEINNDDTNTEINQRELLFDLLGNSRRVTTVNFGNEKFSPVTQRITKDIVARGEEALHDPANMGIRRNEQTMMKIINSLNRKCTTMNFKGIVLTKAFLEFVLTQKKTIREITFVSCGLLEGFVEGSEERVSTDIISMLINRPLLLTHLRVILHDAILKPGDKIAEYCKVLETNTHLLRFIFNVNNNSNSIQKALANNYTITDCRVQDVEQYMCRNRAVANVLDQLADGVLLLLMIRHFRITSPDSNLNDYDGYNKYYGRKMNGLLLRMPKEILIVICKHILDFRYSKKYLKQVASDLGYK